MFLNVNKKNRLTDFAVPTLFSDETLAKRESNSDLTRNESLDLSTPMACSSPIPCTSTNLSLNITSDSSSRTPDHLSYSTPRKVVLRTQLKEAKEKIKSLEKTLAKLSNVLAENDSTDTFLKQCQKILSPSLLLIVRSHLMCKSRKKPGPRVYNFMKTTLSLPSTVTLKRTTSKFEMQSGFNDFLFSFINLKTKNYSAETLQCILCADQMSIKSHLYYLTKKDEIMGFNITNCRKTYEPAKYALVLMLRGINVSWKLPIAYFFSFKYLYWV